MGKSVTLGWLCPRTVTLVPEPPFCDMSYMSLPIVTFGCTQMVRAERPRSGSKPPKIDPAIQIAVEAAIRIDVAVNQRCEAAIIIRRHPARPFRFHQHALKHSGEIGRASCRERVCQYVSIAVVAVSLKKKQTN